MLVHLVGSIRNLDEDVKNLRKIIEVVHDKEGTLTLSWLDAAIVRRQNNVVIKDWTPFVQDNMNALERSDVVIIEATYYTFSHGFQMAAALDDHKPVLVVSKERLNYKFITGFTSSLLTYKSYSSESELEHIVSSFLKKNTIHTKDLRFNIMLTRKLSRYLDEKSQERARVDPKLYAISLKNVTIRGKIMGKFTTPIHLIASGNDLDNDLPYLQKIIEVIYKNQAILTHDWLGAAIARKKRTPDTEKADWKNIVDESLDAIKRSDLVIAEITLSDFNLGIQTYFAASYKKPTLVLTRSQFGDNFISGISSRYLTVRQYNTKEELETLVTDFIQKNTIPAKDLRFNMFLDRRIYKYLRDKAYETGKNKSEIVRDLIERQIKKRQ